MVQTSLCGAELASELESMKPE